MKEKQGKAIFGGSFDPIHRGHLAIAEAAYAQLPVDEVILMPTRLRYYKKSSVMTRDEERLAMLELSVEPYPYMSVSTMELSTPVEENYTVNTLNRLKVEHPDWEIYFVMGGDSLAYLDTWYRAEELMQLATFVAAVREDVDAEQALLLMGKYRREFPGSRFSLLHTDPVDISSTEIRRRVAEGGDISEMVPTQVETYIRKHGLYLPAAEPDAAFVPGEE